MARLPPPTRRGTHVRLRTYNHHLAHLQGIRHDHTIEIGMRERHTYHTEKNYNQPHLCR